MEPISRQDTLSATQAAPATPAKPADLTGRTLGDYRLLRRLGEGGMGTVYLAEQLSLHRKVALKFLRPDLAANATTLQRFKIEAEAAARVNHANIVQVHAIGEADGLHYMALEYVEGRTLRDYLEKKGPPELLISLSIMRQVAAALQRAHELGVIHRDIKPENILLTRRTEVKVADFGLSRIFAEDRQSPSLTQSNVTMGTPLYMSPEQIENRNLDSRSDIYSFGVTCYHLLAGRPPFHGQTAFEVVAQHVQNEPPPLSQVRPDLPPELCTLVHRMMAKRPEDRPQTGREIGREVGRLRDVLAGVTSPRSDPLITTGPAPASPADVHKTRPVQVRRRRRLPWIIAASLLLSVAAGGVFGWLQRPSAAAPAASHLPLPPPLQAVVSEDKKEEEKLQDDVKRYVHSKDWTEQQFGLHSAMKLGLLYVKQRRLDKADQLFKGLFKDARKQHKGLGVVGQAIVLAFRDRPAESNKLFLGMYRLLHKMSSGQPLNSKIFWMTNRDMRQTMAEALERNYQNAPLAFPSELDPLRRPPQPPRPQAKK
jgi:tRNA A-37 threonylcarbamoyl transferase component Bud32